MKEAGALLLSQKAACYNRETGEVEPFTPYGGVIKTVLFTAAVASN